jgi:hypothetical protein
MQSQTMQKQTNIYNLQQYAEIAFNGFEFTIPPETMDIITKLSIQVGSPTYIKTPVFHTRANNVSNAGNFGQNTSSSSSSSCSANMKKKNGNKSTEVTDDDWESLRTFHATKIEKKEGLDGIFDKIRYQLNKITDKNYVEFKNNIIALLDSLIEEGASEDDMSKIGNALFDIASNNRFYSKLYADLYAELINKYSIMGEVFEKSYSSFMKLFDKVECGDPDKNYDDFCRINKVNECRRALSLFFVNLTTNTILTKMQLINTLHTLFVQLYNLIKIPNMLNESTELTEIIGIIYSKSLISNANDEFPNEMKMMLVDGHTINDLINKIATSKAKEYPSLSSKAKFKFMDILESK